jgi:anti-anti-sigma regulatory factor
VGSHGSRSDLANWTLIAAATLTSINRLAIARLGARQPLALTEIKEASSQTGKIALALGPGADIVGRDVLPAAPLLSVTRRDGQLYLAAAGAWTAPHAAELEVLVDSLATEMAPAHDVAIDMQGVQEFDTYGAWLLRRLTRAWQERGQQMCIAGLPDRYQGLIQEVNQATAEREGCDLIVMGSHRERGLSAVTAIPIVPLSKRCNERTSMRALCASATMSCRMQAAMLSRSWS